jgi:hypothetical protein
VTEAYTTSESHQQVHWVPDLAGTVEVDPGGEEREKSPDINDSS